MAGELKIELFVSSLFGSHSDNFLPLYLGIKWNFYRKNRQSDVDVVVSINAPNHKRPTFNACGIEGPL